MEETPDIFMGLDQDGWTLKRAVGFGSSTRQS
jgi:hypothetical protein